jgi:hypothetical protein
MIFLSLKWQMWHNFKYFGQHIEISGKKLKLHVLGIDTDPDRPDPVKLCGSDPI